MWQSYVIQKTNFLGNQSYTPSPLKKEKNSCKSIYIHFLHKGLNDEASEKPWVMGCIEEIASCPWKGFNYRRF